MEDVSEYIRTPDTYSYPYESQMKHTSHCGFFSIYVARRLKDYLALHPNAIFKMLDKVIVSSFGTSADGGDVQKLRTEFIK